MSSNRTNPAYTNRLVIESSPYLLQHAHNPVDWYPWGPEAFKEARRNNKPIFLSVGYSTCYWCHVMERQCFENPDIAKEMNELFVNIKVDREERPDVDQLYMTAVQLITRHGGWPMSVFLTPALRPFFGGTYFPPTDAHGRPGFVTVLHSLNDAYRNRAGDVDKQAEHLHDLLEKLAGPTSLRGSLTIDQSFLRELIRRSTEDYDSVNGGFGTAPKFPRQTLLELILAYTAHDPDTDLLKKIVHTLDQLAMGGIRDQLGGGFHRYSTDAEWLVPHFEIMLYDNAMLAWIYIEAYRQTEELQYAKVAREILSFILLEMTSPEGAFYTAFDAEVDAMEGQSYLWTESEILSILGADDARFFNKIYGVDQGPNFADPHHGTGEPDQNILFLTRPVTAEEEEKLSPMRARLLAVRHQRKQPLLDTKILTSWNALMIRAFAYAGRVLQEPAYIEAAEKAADFILRQHRTPDGGLYRTSRDGKAKTNGFLDDYAGMIQALMGLHEASGRDIWKDHAAALTIMLHSKFGDEARGGFFFSEAGADDLIVRQKTAGDSPLPSGNAMAALALLDMGYPEHTRGTIEVFAEQMRQQGEGMSALVQAALEYVMQHGAIEVGGSATKAMDAMSGPAPLKIASAWVSPTELLLRLTISPGFHLNGPESSGQLVPTVVTVNGETPAIEYGPSERKKYAYADEPIDVYEGETIVRLKFANSPAGPVQVAVKYQACTEDACLLPSTQRVEVPLM